MGPLDWVTAHLGLLVLTVISVALTLYLVYVMVRPERF